MSNQYRKKPVVIEAVQWFKEGDHPAVHADARSPTGWAIYTLENTEIKHEVTPGDWIITGVQGEHYPCKPAIFAATYEPEDAAATEPAEAFDFTAHLHRQQQFSAKTFGPGKRVQGVTDHIAKELIEVRESDGDLSEWIDVVILGLDGALRSATPEQIVAALIAKQAKNEARRWPDWRTADPNKAIEHDRSHDTPADSGAKEPA
jgi:hypothetical protein